MSMHLRTAANFVCMQVVIVGSKHKLTEGDDADKREAKKSAEMYRTESGWGEVDNCWGQLGYVNVMLYHPPSYSDVVMRPLRKGHSRLSLAQREFRNERNADIIVQPEPFGDIIAVALRHAKIPYQPW